MAESQDDITTSMADELENLMVARHYDKTPDKVVKVFDRADVDLVVPQEREKRIKTLLDALRSPYVRRVISLNTRRDTMEEDVCAYMFSAWGKLWDVIFSIDNELDIPKVTMKIMHPGIWVHVDAITAWALVLNYEERYMSKNIIRRLFCSAIMLSEDDYNASEEQRIERFSSNIVPVLRSTGIATICAIDLLFVPVIYKKHYYLVCFNLKTTKLEVIDNIKSEEEFSSRYIPNNVIFYFQRNAFAGYLSCVEHPVAKKMKDSVPVRLEMPWRTMYNDIDCGVFVMRHMETYKGTIIKDWICSLSNEVVGEQVSMKQKQELDDLRRKYVVKMLLSDVNKCKKVVENEVKMYLQLKLDYRKRLQATTVNRIGELLKTVD